MTAGPHGELVVLKAALFLRLQPTFFRFDVLANALQ